MTEGQMAAAIADGLDAKAGSDHTYLKDAKIKTCPREGSFEFGCWVQVNLASGEMFRILVQKG